MTKIESTRRVTVCLLSSHPLVLEEFQRFLPKPRFLVRPLLVDQGLTRDLSDLPVPPASVYAVDSSGPSTSTLVAGLLNRSPKARILVLAKNFNEMDSYAYLHLGAKGLLSYAKAPKQLPEAIRTIARSGFWVDRSLLSRFVDSLLPNGRSRVLSSGVARLSPRQREVLDGLLQNLSNKEIAAKLQRSERNAKFHVSNLLAKFGVRRREELVALYYQGRMNYAGPAGVRPVSRPAPELPSQFRPKSKSGATFMGSQVA